MWDSSYSTVVHKAYSGQFGGLLATSRIIRLQNTEILPLLTPWRLGTSGKLSQQARITCCFSKCMLLPTIWISKTYCKNANIQWNWTESQEQLMIIQQHKLHCWFLLDVYRKPQKFRFWVCSADHLKLRLDIMKNFIMKRFLKHWKGLPWVVVESPSLKVLKRCVGVVLRDLV